MSAALRTVHTGFCEVGLHPLPPECPLGQLGNDVSLGLELGLGLGSELRIALTSLFKFK